MSGNSLEQLLQWMRDPASDVMRGWGAIVAMSRDKANQILAQDYIERFDSNSSLPPISGEITLSRKEYKELIHDFVLDAPRLSFENAQLQSSLARLAMPVISGMQVSMLKTANVWQTSRVAEVNALQGPTLYLELELDRVPGEVDTDGRVKLDLQHSDRFTLTFVRQDADQLLGGEFFRQQFNALPEQQRVFVLGRIEQGNLPLLQPQSFRLRTQGDGSAGAEGALLVFLRMSGSEEGQNIGSNWRYLIPDDPEKQYSAALLLGQSEILSSTLLGGLCAGFSELQMNLRYLDGRLACMEGAAGYLVIPGATHVLTSGEVEVNAEVGELRLPVASAQPLSLSVQQETLAVEWHTADTTTVTFRVGNATMRTVYTAGASLSARYQLGSTANCSCMVERSELVVTPFAHIGQSPESVGGGVSEVNWNLVLIVAMSLLPPLVKAGLRARVARAFEESFDPGPLVEVVINDLLQFGFRQAIVPESISAPRDYLCVGHVNPVLTAFSVSPQQAVVGAGGHLDFVSEPAVAGLTWSLTALQGDEAGQIDASGRYQAPAAGHLQAASTRVRVTATHASGERSSALITVMTHAISVDPLIVVCDSSDPVELQAAHLDNGQLEWQILNPVAGESGQLEASTQPDGDHAYRRAVGPVPGKTFVLDEVQVRHVASGQTRSIHVLAQFNTSPLLVRVAAQSTLEHGRVQLQALLNGQVLDTVQWRLPLAGPGQIDDQGWYSADEDASPGFALVFARIEASGLSFENFIILPLPLASYPSEMALLGEGPDSSP